MLVVPGVHGPPGTSPAKQTKYAAVVSGPQENTYAGTGYYPGYMVEREGMFSGQDRVHQGRGTQDDMGYSSGYHPTSEHIYECPESLNNYSGTAEGESTSRQYYDLDPTNHGDKASSAHAPVHMPPRDKGCGHEDRCTCAGRQGSAFTRGSQNNNHDYPYRGRCENSQSF